MGLFLPESAGLPLQGIPFPALLVHAHGKLLQKAVHLLGQIPLSPGCGTGPVQSPLSCHATYGSSFSSRAESSSSLVYKVFRAWNNPLDERRSGNPQPPLQGPPPGGAVRLAGQAQLVKVQPCQRRETPERLSGEHPPPVAPARSRASRSTESSMPSTPSLPSLEGAAFRRSFPKISGM